MKTMSLTAFGRGGLTSLIQSYKRMGCEVIEDPHETKDGTKRWTCVITHPFPNEA